MQVSRSTLWIPPNPHIHAYTSAHRMYSWAESVDFSLIFFFFFFYSSNPPVCLTVLLSTFSVVWKRCALSFNLTICAARSMPAPHVFCQFLFCKNKQRDSLSTVTPVDPSPPVFKKKKTKKKRGIKWPWVGHRAVLIKHWHSSYCTQENCVVTLMVLDELET